MDFLYERIGEIIKQIEKLRCSRMWEVNGWKGIRRHIPITDYLNVNKWEWREGKDVLKDTKKGAWFALTTEIIIKKDMSGSNLELWISTGREGRWDATNPQIAVYINGKLEQGLDTNHRAIYLCRNAEEGNRYEVTLLVYTGEEGKIEEWKSRLCAVDETITGLYYDLCVPWKCLELMEEGSGEYLKLLKILNDTINILDLRKPYSTFFWKSVKNAKAFLKKETEKLPKSEVTAFCVGHTHIDIAWLWTLEITREKAARSFSSVLKLMDRYPEYKFMSSQPQLYEYIKENQPVLYKKIKDKIKEGRWEPEGAMFLEADCNLTSGESLVRQCLYGKNFFKQEFNVESHILWLPDVFGYSAALPQIMKKCGIDSFMTTKISWNEKNKIPCDTFWWEGIDGTKILTHFITTRDYEKNGKRISTNNEFTTAFSTNYNGDTEPSQVKGAWQRYQQKEENQNILISYGYGDGGGGPTEKMLETARRLRRGAFGCPAVKLETANNYFSCLHTTAEKQKFPLWSGELYLEYHRGTYTSMAEIKRFNRKGEFALLNIESLGTLGEENGIYNYDRMRIRKLWKILMRNQFHDILPGSSIEEVYTEAEKEYCYLFQETEKIQEEELSVLTEAIEGEKGEIIVFNPNGINITEIVESVWPEEKISGVKQGEVIYPVQKTENGTWIFKAHCLPQKGWKKYQLIKEESVYWKQVFFWDDTSIETPYYYLKWNEKGQIASLYDRVSKRQLLKDGMCGNVLMTYEDKPYKYDNWNIFEYYQEKKWSIEDLISRRVVESGPVRMAVELIWKYLDSQIKEIFYFYPDSARIDIHSEILWKEEQILLKALFPFDLNVRDATYDIQYGNVKRSTTANQSWEQAQFEVCFHKWMDISECDYGISILTDSKYGVSVDKNQIGLTLLKSGVYPNKNADKGHHKFVYSIYPHKDDWRKAGVVGEAYGLNNPPVATIKRNKGDYLPSSYSSVDTGGKNIIAEVWKKSEDGDGIILRIYECWNKRTKAKLTFGRCFRRIYLCDMLEVREKLLAENTSVCEIECRGYEILTLRLEI